MATKTYKTYNLKGLQLLLFDDSGNTVLVNFKSGNNWADNTCTFTTSDEDVQSEIESCSGLNRDYYIED